jgi:non-specific serine/threonine protein kinase
MSKLTGDTTPETMATKAKLADAYAQQIGKMTGDKQLGSAQLVADSAMKMFPGVPNVMKEVGKLTEARKAYEAEQQKATALARVDDLKNAVIAQAKANDTASALKALNELKAALPASDPFLANEGPKALAEAYQRSAERQAQQGRFDVARRFVADGLKVAPASQALKDLDRKYAVEGSVATLQGGAQQVSSVKGEDMKAALDAIRGEDAARAEKVGAEVQGNVLARLQALTKSDPSAAGRGKAEWLKVFPQSAQLASLVIPEATTPAPATTVPSLPQEAKKAATTAPRVHGQETCRADMAKFGKNGKANCQDDVAGAPGPKLVVIPNPAGGVMAITKYEITVGQFDAFCRATAKCKPAGGNDALPRTNVSLAQVRAYAAWLTETTGFTYRLPTDAEWSYAANAGGEGAGEDYNCVLMQGGNPIKGTLPVPATSGRPNPWGLINAVGNVAEWVEGGSVRGGHFNVPMSQCTVDWKQSGSESDSIGVRLVREMG